MQKRSHCFDGRVAVDNVWFGGQLLQPVNDRKREVPHLLCKRAEASSKKRQVGDLVAQVPASNHGRRESRRPSLPKSVV